MTITFQATKRFPATAGSLADNLLANLERIASVEQPYTEIVHIEELRNDNQERVIQVWGFTFAFALVALAYRPSHSHGAGSHSVDEPVRRPKRRFWGAGHVAGA